jgi:hypothetical protein
MAHNSNNAAELDMLNMQDSSSKQQQSLQVFAGSSCYTAVLSGSMYCQMQQWQRHVWLAASKDSAAGAWVQLQTSNFEWVGSSTFTLLYPGLHEAAVQGAAPPRQQQQTAVLHAHNMRFTAGDHQRPSW